MSGDAEVAVALHDVTKAYRQGDHVVRALDHCTLEVRTHEFMCVLGPSGTGKTTLLNVVAGFERPDGGSVTVLGEGVTSPGVDRGVVFQAPTLLPWRTALDNVAMAVVGKGSDRATRRRVAGALLADVGLTEAMARRFPYQLSGGMQQRVGIARALALQPNVMLLDEPFSALDTYVRQELQRQVVSLWLDRRFTTIMITHSVEEALSMAGRIAIMANGRVERIVEVPFAYPRDPTSADFNRWRREIDGAIEAGVLAERGRAAAGSLAESDVDARVDEGERWPSVSESASS